MCAGFIKVGDAGELMLGREAVCFIFFSLKYSIQRTLYISRIEKFAWSKAYETAKLSH
jgi:hypothetical protein